jgi:glycosyltransferase involved in cell wall biosynthesis
MLFSIVTVTFNAAQFLEKTIASVLNQNFKEYEYIIIDGNSSDGTQEIIKSHSNDLSYWTSEKDTGIYNAMNKAVAHCRGEWVIFMNAGDTFASDDILSEIANHRGDQSDIIYGDRNRIDANGNKRHQKAGKLDDAYQREVVFHQSCFIRTRLLRERPYDESYRLAADYEFTLYALSSNKKFHYTGITISNFLEGGVSNKSYLLSHIEAIKASITYAPSGTCIHENFFFKSLVSRNIGDLFSSQIQSSIKSNPNFKLELQHSEMSVGFLTKGSTAEFSHLLNQINKAICTSASQDKLIPQSSPTKNHATPECRGIEQSTAEQKTLLGTDETTQHASLLSSQLINCTEENKILLKQLHLAQEKIASITTKPEPTQKLTPAIKYQDKQPHNSISTKIKNFLRQHLSERRIEQLHRLRLKLYKPFNLKNRHQKND